MRSLVAAFALMFATMIVGCGEDPAKDVTKVTAEPPKPVPAETKPAVADAKPAPADTKPADQSKAVSETPVAVSAVAAAAPAGALVFSDANSKVEFVGSKKIGTDPPHPGGFKAFTGHAVLVEGKPELKSLTVDIDTTSLFSDNEKLTEHLKNKDFFEVATYPTSKFVTTEIKTGGEKGATHSLVGNLTLHGVTKSIAIPATVKVEGNTLTLKSEFALNKNDFGMTFGGPGDVIRHEVVIKLDVKAEKKG